MGAPADRNVIDFSVNAGVSLKSPLPNRDGDTFGVGYGFAKVSGRASDLDRDTASLSASFKPIRSSEHFVEVTYQYQVAPWWQLQPDFQYIFNPSGGILNPSNANERLGNEAVFGIRTNITF